MHVGRRKEDVKRSGSSTVANERSTALRRQHFVWAAGVGVIIVLTIGWIWVIGSPHMRTAAAAVPPPTARATGPLTRGAPAAAYLTDAAMRGLAGELRGASGKLRVKIRVAGETLEADSAGQLVAITESESSGSSVAPRAGIWRLAAALNNAVQPIANFNLISTRPASEKSGGRMGLYYIGNYPGEGGGGAVGPKKAPSDRYRPPSGYIEVTRENADTYVSEHFRLRDFLTHDQPNVWPKYLVLQMRNVDKLELVLSDLEKRGINPRAVRVMSGFRTPQYNKGGGNTGGRAGLSRHMYGDAADIFIDNNGDGVMDDLNHDGRIDINDSRVIEAAVNRVEAAHPELIGGAGVYVAAAGHGPFIHIDSRGYRARWVGSGGG
jgi:hypothetical protein